MSVPTRLAVRMLVKTVVRGREYLAEQPGPFIFVANHPSALDAPLVADALSRVVPRLVSVGVQPDGGLKSLADRLQGNRSASRLAAKLEHGTSVLLFPENTRSEDGSLTPFNAGAALLGIRTGVPIVPVTVIGSYRALPPWRVLPEAGRPKVTVVFGKPIQAAAGSEPAAVTDSIVKAITFGLSEEHSGWYDALRADAEGTTPSAEDLTGIHPAADEAHWRRIWKATTPETETRRKVWV